jgi:uncharacterized protein (TIRG00374 family)
MSRRTALRALLGVTISVIAAVVLLQTVDVGKALALLGRTSPAVVLAMIGSGLVDVGARGARWRALLAPIRSIPYRRVLGYTYVGYLANNVLPARLGELVRSHAVGEREGISRTTVLGTVVVERIVDTVIVVALAAVAVVALGVGGVISTWVVVGAGFVAVLVVGLAVATLSHRLPGAGRVTVRVERFPVALELGRRLRDGLRVAGRPRTLAAALLLSAVAWAASITTFILGGRALGVELSPMQGALLSSGVALVTIVPAAPGYLGTFELTAVSIASQFGIDAETGFAMALLVHALILALTSVGGIIAAVRLGVGLGTAEAGDEDGGAEVDPVRS